MFRNRAYDQLIYSASLSIISSSIGDYLWFLLQDSWSWKIALKARPRNEMSYTWVLVTWVSLPGVNNSIVILIKKSTMLLKNTHIMVMMTWCPIRVLWVRRSQSSRHVWTSNPVILIIQLYILYTIVPFLFFNSHKKL